MAYRKQEVYLTTGDVLDADFIDRALAAPAEEVCGMLNEHNINASAAFANSKVDDAAYWKLGFISESVDPRIVENDTPGPGGTDIYQVADTYEWDRAGGIFVTMTTGESVVQVEAWLQYGVWVVFQIAGFDQRYSIYNHGRNPNIIIDGLTSATLPRLQAALRVDGIILEQTITGVENVMDRAPKAIYPATPGKGDTATSYSIHTFRSDDTTSMESPCQPIRLGFAVPVAQGSHTFELVVRRVPIHDDRYIDSNSFSGLFMSGWCPVYVFSRKMICIEHRAAAVATGGSSTFSIPSYSESATLTAASIQTDRLYKVRDQVNDLVPGNLARGALRKEHLPSRVLYPAQQAINSSANTQTVYPGYGADTGWANVVDSVGVVLQTSNGPLDFAANPCFVVVWATVYVRLIDCDGGFESQRQQAQFAIQRVNSDATTEVDGVNIAYINASNCDTNTNMTDMYDEYQAVHLLAYWDYRTAAPSKQIDRYRVVASVYDSTIGGNTKVTWYRGNIQMLCFRP